MTIYQAKAGSWEIAVAADSEAQALTAARLDADLPFRGRDDLYVWPVAGDWLYFFGGKLAATADEILKRVRESPMIVWRSNWNRRG